MKINVIDKTAKIQLGSIYELRGNFVEKTDEDGNISYECDMFRTKDKTKTFDDLYQLEQIEVAKQFITDFDYVENKIIRESQLYGNDILDTKSDKIDMTYREILAKKEEYVKLLNNSSSK